MVLKNLRGVQAVMGGQYSAAQTCHDRDGVVAKRGKIVHAQDGRLFALQCSASGTGQHSRSRTHNGWHG